MGTPIAIDDLEAKVNLLRTRPPMDTWEIVSDRVAFEISRVSAAQNERVTEVERAVQTHSNTSLATSSDQSRAIQKDFQRLDSKVEVSLRAFPREVKIFGNGWRSLSTTGGLPLSPVLGQSLTLVCSFHALSQCASPSLQDINKKGRANSSTTKSTM